LVWLLVTSMWLWVACNGDTGSKPDTDGNKPVVTDAGGSKDCVSGALCDDGEPCTLNDTCIAGECLGTLLDCEDDNACTTDGCDDEAQTCVYGHANEGAACDDASACTSDESCKAGVCSGTAKACKDDKVCTWDGCDPATGDCLHQEGNKACDDGNLCTTDACHPVTGCSHKATNEGNPCAGGICTAGACVAGPEGMELIPAGTFWRGCNDSVEKEDCLPEERPQHEVQLSAFWMHRNHVTVTEYKKCVQAKVCTPPIGENISEKHYNYKLPGREQHPINGVNWFQSKAYCEWLGLRLPTEAEWEMAARGSCAHNPGSDCATAMRKFPWGSSAPTCDVAIFDPSKRGVSKGCGHDTTWEVGQKPGGKSPYGLYDMGGNAWDWVADCYVEGAYAKYKDKKAIDPIEDGCDKDAHRVFRGGSFYSFPIHLRAGRRDRYYPQFEYDCVSFRCAKSFSKP